MRRRPSRSVLVVHEDRRFSLLLRIRLLRKGFRVREARDARHFRVAVEEERPDLILLGERLDGESGPEAYEWLLALGLDTTIPVILLAESAEGKRPLRFRPGRRQAVYRKPWNALSLVRDIAQSLLPA